MTVGDAILNEMKTFYEQAKSGGLETIRWEQLPVGIRAYIKSKYGYELTGLTLGALATIIKEYEDELKKSNLLQLELTKEEKNAMREAIKEVDEFFRETSEMGGILREAEEEREEAEADKFNELVDGIAAELLGMVKDAIAPATVSDILIRVFHFATMDDTNELCYYDSGVYKPSGELLIKRVLQLAFKKANVHFKLTRRFVDETIEHIKRATLHRRSEFDKNKWIINVKNGLLDIWTLELKPHDPGYLSIIQLPVEWDPQAYCPRWDKFISEIVEPEDAKVLQEFVGYTLLRDCRYQKALMLVGSGANGKTTFLKVIIRMLGIHNLSFRSLHELTTNRFATADLYGKLANIYDDLSAETISNTGIFKILVAGGEIQAEKKFRNSFKFKNFAKLIFSANKVPSTYDDTRAFYRRWIIVNFPNEFTGDKADPHLEEKLTTKECLSYVLKWAVAGLRRLLTQGKFSYDDDVEKIEDRYLRASNPAYAFLMDQVEEDPEAAISKDELYNAFLDFCRANKLPTVSKNAFSKQVKRWTRATDGWVKIEGRSVRAWRGIRLKSGSENQKDDEKEGLDVWIIKK